MLNKEGCQKSLDNIKMLGGIYIPLDSLETIENLIKEHFRLVEEHNTLLSRYNMLKHPQPYKFEDLKEGMWVWDNKFNDCMKIKIVFEPCKLYPNGSLKAYHDLNEETLNFIEFEEGRFFPITKALEYQEKEVK